MNNNYPKYICKQCLKGDCKRYKTGDTNEKEAYKCVLCGFIYYVRK